MQRYNLLGFKSANGVFVKHEDVPDNWFEIRGLKNSVESWKDMYYDLLSRTQVSYLEDEISKLDVPVSHSKDELKEYISKLVKLEVQLQKAKNEQR